MAKRTKQVEQMIDVANEVLKNNKVIDESNDLFWMPHWMLLQTGTYRGYNWYYEEDYVDVMGKHTMIQRPCCTSDPEKIKEMNGYIQLL